MPKATGSQSFVVRLYLHVSEKTPKAQLHHRASKKINHQPVKGLFETYYQRPQLTF